LGVFTTNDVPGCPTSGLLSGTEKADKLHGKKGDDEIHGLDGVDLVIGGDGDDVIYGGPGDDARLLGDDGDDVIYGGDGDNEELSGWGGEDVLYGGDGNDTLDGTYLEGALWGVRLQRDKLYCGEGRDEYMADRHDYVDSSCEKKVKLYTRIDWTSRLNFSKLRSHRFIASALPRS
jgi:Ca2+-binding RTX toxin-like protein